MHLMITHFINRCGDFFIDEGPEEAAIRADQRRRSKQAGGTAPSISCRTTDKCRRTR